jgi:DNA polymerase-3 subunit delta'
MILVGLEDKIEEFKKLIKENKLRQSYLFFGEPGIGKFTFARCLVNFLESGEFIPANKPLIDSKIFQPEACPPTGGETGFIGIDSVRRLKQFLYQRPLISCRRSAIFDEADSLTPEAQNALLKIIEEPPSFSLIIFISREPSVFSSTLASRFTKVYFPRLSQKSIARFLKENFQVEVSRAAAISRQSFGRIGRALQLLNPKPLDVSTDSVSEYLENLILSLRKNLFKNSSKLIWLLEREELLKRYNLNPKLQFKAIQQKINE